MTIPRPRKAPSGGDVGTALLNLSTPRLNRFTKLTGSRPRVRVKSVFSLLREPINFAGILARRAANSKSPASLLIFLSLSGSKRDAMHSGDWCFSDDCRYASSLKSCGFAHSALQSTNNFGHATCFVVYGTCPGLEHKQNPDSGVVERPLFSKLNIGSTSNRFTGVPYGWHPLVGMKTPCFSRRTTSMNEQRTNAVENKDACSTNLFARARSLVLFAVLFIIARRDVTLHILVKRDSMKCCITCK